MLGTCSGDFRSVSFCRASVGALAPCARRSRAKSGRWTSATRRGPGRRRRGLFRPCKSHDLAPVDPWLAPGIDAGRLGPGNALGLPIAAYVSLKLGKDREHAEKGTSRRRRLCPRSVQSHADAHRSSSISCAMLARSRSERPRRSRRVTTSVSPLLENLQREIELAASELAWCRFFSLRRRCHICLFQEPLFGSRGSGRRC